MSQYFSASDGQRLGYSITGSGPRLICVPGGPGRAATYLDRLGRLDEDYTLVLLDTRGSGASRPAEPDTLTVERLATDLDELRSHLQEAAPVLLAHSFGCRLAVAFAQNHPGVARALILITPPPMGETDTVAAGRAAILAAREGDPDLADAIEAVRAIPDAGPRDRTMLERLTVPLWYGHWNDSAKAHAVRAVDETPARTALTLRWAAREVPPPDLSALDLPILLIAGQFDHLSPPVAIHALHERLRCSTYAEIEGAAHYPWIDEPDLLRTVIGEFLDGLGAEGVG